MHIPTKVTHSHEEYDHEYRAKTNTQLQSAEVIMKLNGNKHFPLRAVNRELKVIWNPNSSPS